MGLTSQYVKRGMLNIGVVALHLRKLALLTVSMAALLLGGCGDTYQIGEIQTAQPAGTQSRAPVKPALIRLEDVGPGGPYEKEENLHKLYVIADYLHQEGVPFHISLIPRLVIPKKSYDASIADNTPYVRRFNSTIGQMQNLGGIVGIHGYTHQSGSDPSAWGFEFYDLLENPRVPNTYEYARDRIDKALALSDRAGLTPAYWETPHYTASIKQHPAFEEQMGLLYENKHRGELSGNYKVSDLQGQGYRGFVTVPAPLGAIERDGDVERIIKKLDHPGNDLASFFYHSFREFKYMYKDRNAKGEVYYVYDQNSPLHVLIRAFKEKGYTFVSVYSLVRFVPAQRLEGFTFAEGDQVLAGRFGEDGKNGLLAWDRARQQCRIYQYTAPWYTPRRTKAFAVRVAGIDDPGKDSVLLAGDFNGNKRDDLMVFSPGQGIRLLENTGERFVNRGKINLNLPGFEAVCPLVGDFNGDGLADLAFNDLEDGRVGIALGNGSKGFRQIRWITMDSLKGQSYKLLAGDFNGDGRDDIAVLDTSGGDWKVLMAGPGGKKLVPAGIWMKKWGGGRTWQPFAADLNGDGKCDMVLYSKLGHWQVVLSDGQKFIYQGDFGPWGSIQKGVARIADLNGDGRSDLVVIDETKGKGCNLDLALSVMGM